MAKIEAFQEGENFFFPDTMTQKKGRVGEEICWKFFLENRKFFFENRKFFLENRKFFSDNPESCFKQPENVGNPSQVSNSINRLF